MSLKLANVALRRSSPASTKTAATPRLSVKVISPYAVYYAGWAISISATNSTGRFDILYNHANFFSLLAAGDLIINTGSSPVKLSIDRGIMKVTRNQVDVFVDV